MNTPRSSRPFRPFLFIVALVWMAIGAWLGYIGDHSTQGVVCLATASILLAFVELYPR